MLRTNSVLTSNSNTMNKLLLLVATLITLTAKSQTLVYHPFPDSSAMWCDYRASNNSGCLSESKATYELNGQTIINGMVYNRLRHYERYYEYCTAYSDTDTTTFYIRQDVAVKKVWIYIPSTNSDTILYDFKLQVGDTLNQREYWAINFQSPDYWIVSSIDSILIDGNYRKQFHYSPTFAPTCFSSMIEGIGADHGLINLPQNCFEYWATLVKSYQNGILLYGDSSPFNYACHDFTLDITEIKIIKTISICPNPVTNKLNVTTNNKELSEIILYDISSRKLVQKKFTNTVSLNTEQLDKGIYIYEVRDRNGLCKKGKVVKD